MGRHLTIDVKTGERKMVEKEDLPAPAPVTPVEIDLVELAKLLEYAKRKHWI